jgi:hypothetical protein
MVDDERPSQRWGHHHFDGIFAAEFRSVSFLFPPESSINQIVTVTQDNRSTITRCGRAIAILRSVGRKKPQGLKSKGKERRIR